MDMDRFTTGLIAGGIIGAVGLTIAMSDRRTRKRIVREGKRVANRAGDMLDDVTRKF